MSDTRSVKDMMEWLKSLKYTHSVMWVDESRDLIFIEIQERNGYGRTGVAYKLYFKNPFGEWVSMYIPDSRVLDKVLEKKAEDKK